MHLIKLLTVKTVNIKVKCNLRKGSRRLKEIEKMSQQTMEIDSQSSNYSGSQTDLPEDTYNDEISSQITGKSEIWDYFLNVNNDQYNKKRRIKCNVDNCKVILISKNGSTTSLWRHLYRSHKNLYLKTQKYYKEKQKNNITGPMDRMLNNNNSSYNHDEFCKLLVDFIVNESKPITQVENNSFISLLLYLNPNCCIPSASTMKRWILNSFEEKRNQLYYYFHQLDSNISFTADMWKSPNHFNFMGITTHFIDDEYRHRGCTIDFTIILGQHSGEALATAFYQILKDWDIRHKFQSITTDNATANDSMISYLGEMFRKDGYNWYEDECHFRCMGHIINLAVQDSLTYISNTIEKLRDLFIKIKASPQRLQLLKEKCEIANINSQLKTTIDTPTRWNSTYFMIVKGLKLKNAINLLFYDENYVYLVEDLYSLKLDEEEWKELRMIKDFLYPFHNVTNYIEGESYTTITKVIPLFNILLDHVEDYAENILSTNNNLYNASLAAREKLVKYYSKTNSLSMTLITLDPRFNCQYLYDEGISDKDVKLTKEKLIEMLNRYPIINSNENKKQQTKQHERNDGEEDMMDMLFRKKRRLNPNNKGEIDWYLNEEQKDEKCKPLEYWKISKNNKPYISRLARDLFAIPATSTPSERLFSSAGFMINDKRNRLLPKTIRAAECIKSINNFFSNNE